MALHIAPALRVSVLGPVNAGRGIRRVMFPDFLLHNLAVDHEAFLDVDRISHRTFRQRPLDTRVEHIPAAAIYRLLQFRILNLPSVYGASANTKTVGNLR